MNRECVTHHHACNCREERFDEMERENNQQRRIIAALVEQLGGEAVIGQGTMEYLGKFHTLTTENTVEGNLRVRLTESAHA